MAVLNDILAKLKALHNLPFKPSNQFEARSFGFAQDDITEAPQSGTENHLKSTSSGL